MKQLPIALGALVLLSVAACTPTPATTTVTVTAPASTVTITRSVTPVPGSPSPVPTSPAPTLPPASPTPAIVPQDMGTIELKVGERRDLKVGDANDSTRTFEMLSSPPNEQVAVVRLNVGQAPAGCAPGGCNKPQTLELRGVGPGETVVLLTHFAGADGPQSSRQWKIVVR